MPKSGEEVEKGKCKGDQKSISLRGASGCEGGGEMAQKYELQAAWEDRITSDRPKEAKTAKGKVRRRGGRYNRRPMEGISASKQ